MDETQSQIQFEHLFKARPERVFDAWLDPDALRQWMFGPRIRKETVLKIRTDPKVGGSFVFSVERDEQIYDYVGEYFIVDRPSRLVFTISFEEQATESDHIVVTFAAEGAGCRVTIQHNLHPHHSDLTIDLATEWPKMLEVLESVLAGK